MASFRELLIRMGAVRIVEPVVDVAFANVAQREFLEGDRNPHGIDWHVSFHASEFPGDKSQACPRSALYKMMDASRGIPDRWLSSVADVGKAVELTQVRAVRDDGRLVRSNQEGRSSDPDARDENGKPMPQMGFVDVDHWLTGSVDMPLMPFGYNRTHIVEVKTKHESQIDEMAVAMRGCDDAHRRQLLCSLGLAHDNPEAFLHPTEDRPMAIATDGSVYYLARDESWPGPKKTFEFFFEHDPEFMEKGRAHLKKWKEHFLNNELPHEVERKNTRSHPFGWRWSEGVCKYCDFKKACKIDYEQQTSELKKSAVVAAAQFSRPGYDGQKKYEAVTMFWDKIEKFVAESGSKNGVVDMPRPDQLLSS